MASIDELGLSDRIVGNLLEAGITVSDQLDGYTRDDLIALDGIGEVSADEILTALSDLDAAETIDELIQESLSEGLESVDEPAQESPELSDRESLLLEACQWAINVWRAMPGQQPMFLASRMETKVHKALSQG